MRRAIRVLLSVVGISALVASEAGAQQIALSLNLQYNVRTNPDSGGNWTLVGLANEFGIAAIDVKLFDINTAQTAGPRGLVNGGDPAGFSSFVSFELGGGVTEVLAYQFPLDDVDDGHQNIFYGVGTLSNGAPNYPGKPVDANFIGPELPSLTNVSGVPWGVPGSDFLGDNTWSIAVPLARGTFLAGATPAFSGTQRGSVFTTLGTMDSAGTISCGAFSPTGPANCNDPSDETPVMGIVRNDLTDGSGGDYNRDGVVNAADYVVWRNTLGDTVTAPGHGADGDADGTVTEDDYTFWVERFGTVIGAGTGAHTVAVPEPGGGLLTLLGAAAGLLWARNPGIRRPR